MNVEIEFVDVVKRFGAQTILDHVNVKFTGGQTTVIAGGSGQGKSVAIKLILGLLIPDSGQILIDGVDITKINKRELNKIRTQFGVLFQGVALLDSITVFENVALPLRERLFLPAKEVQERVEAALAQYEYA